MQIFADNKYSYRDFPQKYYEFGTVYRYEQKGELNGLLRVRGFTQDDAHIFCTKEQLKTEISNVIDLAFYVLKEKFGFEIELKLSLRDKTKPKYLGKDELWNTAEQALQETLNEKKLNYETEKGEAAFYGPKVDFKVRDALGRLWQLSTVQFDFNLPERFDLKYTDENGEEIRPYVIHRALFGSLERFMGVLIEHFAGAFPFYFAPVQINLLPVADCHKTYAKEIFNKLKSLGIRTEILDSKLTLGKRIRNAEMNKIPYMVILGDQEEKNKTVNIRTYADKEQSEITLTEFINLVVSKNKF
jgi:threonyl-tRNA synthetase